MQTKEKDVAMNHLEIEFKTLLTKEEYDSLKDFFKEQPPIRQTNHYIDTPDQAIRNHQMALRIRTLADRAELTLKVPQEAGHFEYNQALTFDQVESFLSNKKIPKGEIASFLTALEIPLVALDVWGSLETERREKRIPKGLLAFDRSRYNSIEDYELEMEVDAASDETHFHEFLKEKQIEYKPAKSKVARLAQSLLKS
ncbi:adenylate cyclase [Streptococcus ilei]|nr:adenylate cyclase [Streptococcus ilei]